MSSNCVAEFEDEVARFHAFLFTSLGLTFVNLVVSRVLTAKYKDSAPKRLAYYHVLTGGLKVILAICVFSTIPTCPDGCVCTGHTSPAVAILPLLVGLLWLAKGYTFFKQSQQQLCATGNPEEFSSPATELA
jgi:hypothetical protein